MMPDTSRHDAASEIDRGQREGDDWFSWPEWLRQAHSDALMGIDDGNLEPLATYLEAGLPVDRMLRRHIADAIRGANLLGFKLLSKGASKKARRQSAVWKSYNRKLQIGLHAEAILRSPDSPGYDAAVSATALHFKLGNVEHRSGGLTQVKDALAMVRRQLAGDYSGEMVCDLVTLSEFAKQHPPSKF